MNPYKIWLMVVLISGLSFLGYAVIKFVGTEHGIALTGFLGGRASSTAVSLTFSQRSRAKGAARLSKHFSIAVSIAWVSMFIRVIAEVAIVNRGLLASLWFPMFFAATAGGLYCVFLSRSKGSAASNRGEQNVDFTNLFELRPALTFGALYGLILSLAELSQPGRDLAPVIAARAVTLAAMANTVVKAGIVFIVGSPGLKRAVMPGFLLILAAGFGAAFSG